MYKEVAFDPKCMSDIEYYNLIKQHFGFEKGRYVSAEIKTWAREAMTHVKNSDLKPVRKKSVKNYLNKLGHSKTSKEFLLTEDRRNVEAACWNDWLREQKVIRNFSCVVTEAADDDRVNIDQINEDCEEWIVPTSLPVKRTPEDIVGALYPLLMLSRHVTVVDQWFRLSENPALVELIKFIGNTPIRSMRIATSMETLAAQDTYDRVYQPLNKAGVAFEWIKAPEKYFHDRYVITDVGAVRSGQGFMADVEKGIHADKANINIIGLVDALRTLRHLDLLLNNGRATLELSV